MANALLLRLLNPRKFRRDKADAQVRALKQRDGDNCARCRRPIRFDFPAGADQSPAIEPVIGKTSENEALNGLRLCHRRCTLGGVDHTGEVTERVRRKNEAALFSKSRKRRAA